MTTCARSPDPAAPATGVQSAISGTTTSDVSRVRGLAGMIALKSRPDLVDLRSLTDRWRVRRDRRGEDRALVPDPVPLIPGRRGHVEAYALTTLCVFVTWSRPRG
jgi:hypothetical protein